MDANWITDVREVQEITPNTHTYTHIRIHTHAHGNTHTYMRGHVKGQQRSWLYIQYL